jgi:peptidoglycan/LPS O-acetylase OafA/YrhL
VRTTIPRRPGIDGLRAVAVTAVLLYHADISWMRGGFLGVDVFFAISGYLITSLLVAELAARGGISVREFWKRRARRLLPAVGALLVAVTVIAIVGAHDAVSRLRGDVLAAAAYVSNWWQIIRGETYFESFGRPPLLRHLWSLAVEEQLFIVLPLVIATFGRHRRRLAAASFVGAVGSLLLLHALWDQRDPSRAWFGTDTRSAPLLVGVALGLLWPLAERRRWTGVGRTAHDVAGVAGLVGLVALMTTMGDRSSSLPTWGFAATAVLSGIVVLSVTGPSSRIGRVLGMRPLRWLGTRSYAVYLWHWPIYVLTRPRLDVGIDGVELLALRLAITGVLAELSWRFVEQPVRDGSFVRAWFDLRVGIRRRIALAGASAVVVLAASLAVGLTAASVSTTPDLLATVSHSPTTATTLARLTTTSTTTTSLAPTTVTTAPSPPVDTRPVLAVGDSVMLAAAPTITDVSHGHVIVDAAIGRQVPDGLDVLQRYRDSGAFMAVSAVVVHLGTNGAMSDELFHRLVDITAGVPRVVVLNVRVPKSWEGQSNAAIDGGVPQHPTMRLADWYTASAEPGALGDDGVHPTRHGARIYSWIMLDQLADAPPPPPAPTTTAAPPTTTTTSTTTTPPSPASTTTTAAPAPPASLPTRP